MFIIEREEKKKHWSHLIKYTIYISTLNKNFESEKRERKKEREMSQSRRSNTSLSRNQSGSSAANNIASLSGRALNRIEDGIGKMNDVLNAMQLKNLSEHKYSSQGSTLLDPIFQPYWRWLVEKVPLNVAPNLLTIIGLIINVVSSTILVLYSPNATDDVRSLIIMIIIMIIDIFNFDF